MPLSTQPHKTEAQALIHGKGKQGSQVDQDLADQRADYNFADREGSQEERKSNQCFSLLPFLT